MQPACTPQAKHVKPAYASTPQSQILLLCQAAARPLPPTPSTSTPPAAQVVDRASEGLRYQVWRQELRRGLYMYRSVATFQGVAPRDLRPFHLDDHAR